MMDFSGIDLNATGTVALRRMAREAGIKGMSSAKGDDLRAVLAPLQMEQEAEKAAAAAAPAPAKKNLCGVCGVRRIGTTGSDPKSAKMADLCGLCMDEGGWENSHNDEGHGDEEFPVREALTVGCWICHPELNLAKNFTAGRSRAGMVILAKGTKIHKSQTFKVHAETSGWTVQILGSVIGDGGEGDGEERYVAIARRGDDLIELAWNGRAYDYSSSSANLNGKSRKVRNLKEATRLLSA